ncbi:hypothetical protein AGABI1DRAFT_109551 [Agaricus bisporus var. burnettii JB137-S8]|uniref:F-box domain-containing protein n=1 Tax=Agaricus bisporus var. burnettii (strain JB137-S8 / ATCC MYA-4627 / FGSC 10392) TaxID=597362 RepID=K5WJ07_AGABU|nr:uncharacterized protein AGABI1DRAFT_109551 [Agaricus bisporus var. burnettii JB137-S8]EKM75271.1 hypothetical protein AGABI1DRAFT_109551 [Agaricus bisporus var. burnettii JB137-S8]
MKASSKPNRTIQILRISLNPPTFYIIACVAQPAKQSSLPSEIIAEIFKELDWRDSLNARQTCTLLYNASKSREIWDNLIRIHAAAAHGPPTIFDKPMCMYNAAKLEERFLRWMKTESTWLNEIPLDEKYIPDSSHEFLYSHLLRGGRWLICSDFGGEVLYCDLESPETGFIPLIPYPFSRQRESMTMMAVEEDPESKILSFKIALVHILFADWMKGPHGQPEVTGDSRVDVWSGRVILDEDGQVMGLQVEQLASVRISLYLGQPLFGVSLRGSLVAFTVQWRLFGTTIYACDVIIIDWKSQPSRSQSFRRKIVNFLSSFAGDGRKLEVMLLPGDRVLTVLPPGLRIYDHSLVPWSSEERPLVARSESDHLLRVRLSWPDEEGSFETGMSLILDEPNETPLVMNMDVAAGRLAWIATESGRVAMMDL